MTGHQAKCYDLPFERHDTFSLTFSIRSSDFLRCANGVAVLLPAVDPIARVRHAERAADAAGRDGRPEQRRAQQGAQPQDVWSAAGNAAEVPARGDADESQSKMCMGLKRFTNLG